MPRRGRPLAPLTFPYLPVDYGQGVEMAPALDVRLTWHREQLETRMVVDTGSTFSALPSEAAKVLRLELGARVKDRAAVGGPVPARASRVHLQALSPDGSDRILLSFPLDPVLVTQEGRDTPVALLGRKPFFRHFDLLLRERKQEFVLQPVHEP